MLTPFQKSGQGIGHRCVIAMCVCVLIADKALASNSHLIRPFLYYFRSWIDLIWFCRHYIVHTYYLLLFGKIQLTFEKKEKKCHWETYFNGRNTRFFQNNFQMRKNSQFFVSMCKNLIRSYHENYVPEYVFTRMEQIERLPSNLSTQ